MAITALGTALGTGLGAALGTGLGTALGAALGTGLGAAAGRSSFLPADGIARAYTARRADRAAFF